ncbi:MAG TPA: porin [Rheinheimera sp.]|nr:porin [Rheinheimera sp.]
MQQNKQLGRLPVTWTLLAMAVATSSNLYAAVKLNDTTELTYGGYLKLDAIMSDTSDGQIATGIGRDFYVPSLTPIGGEGESATWDLHARQSRFFFGTETQLENGKKITGKLEFDMMSTTIGDQRISNGYAPEIRHAFVSYDGWLFGQTWTTFMDVNALPDTLDFIGTTDGTVFARQAQVRYTTGNWQFAVENPETTVTPTNGGTRIVTDDNTVPDFVARYNLTQSWGTMSFSVLARQLAYETATIKDSTNGIGLSIAGKFNLSPTDDIRFSLTTGKGLGRYVGLNTANDAALTAATTLEAIQSTGYTLAYRHAWSATSRSSIFYSANNIDNPTEHTGTAQTKSTASISANYIYQWAKPLSVGVEFRHATRELESGADGDLNRLQFSVKYDF